MARYIATRFSTMVAVLVASTVIMFLLLHLAPGNPAILMNGGHPPSPATIRYFDRLYGFNKPLPVQYWIWVRHLLQGKLGISTEFRMSVVSVMLPRISLTLLLTAYAVLIMVVVGVPLGIVGAVFRNGPVDFLISFGTLALAGIPNYVAGVILAVVFAVELGWFPAVGGGEVGSLLTRLYHLTLPAIALGLASLALVSRITRSAVVGELESPHVEGARVRGFSRPRIVARHALRGSMVPVVTVVGAQIGYLLGGAIVIEDAFGLPGLGSLLVSAVESKDYPVVQAIALFITAEFLLISFFVDLVYALIDPRVRLVGRTA